MWVERLRRNTIILLPDFSLNFLQLPSSRFVSCVEGDPQTPLRQPHTLTSLKKTVSPSSTCSRENTATWMWWPCLVPMSRPGCLDWGCWSRHRVGVALVGGALLGGEKGIYFQYVFERKYGSFVNRLCNDISWLLWQDVHINIHVELLLKRPRKVSSLERCPLFRGRMYDLC